MSRESDLSKLLALTVPAGVQSAAGSITTNHATSLLAEANALGSVTQLRRHMFATSRRLAQEILREFGFDDFIVRNSGDGAPIWPTGLCGSFSYKKEWSAVVVAECPLFRSLGVDIENLDDIRCSLWEDILAPNELKYVARLANLPSGQLVNLVFSLKEAYFKAQYPITGESELEFRDVEIVPDSNGQISISPLPPSTNAVARLNWGERWSTAFVGLL